MVVQHTRCAMASSSEEELKSRIEAGSGQDVTWMSFNVITDQRSDIIKEVRKARTHPLLAGRVDVGGFLYDVDTGLLEQIC